MVGKAMDALARRDVDLAHSLPNSTTPSTN
jgi:hypothetical protein